MGHTELYRHFDADGRLLYVGMSYNAFQRLCAHKFDSHWFEKIRVVTIEHFDDRAACERAEAFAIRKEKPLYNKQHAVRTVQPACGNLRVIAERLGTTRAKLYRMEKNGKFPVKPVQSATRLWNFNQVDDWFDSIGRILP